MSGQSDLRLKAVPFFCDHLDEDALQAWMQVAIRLVEQHQTPRLAIAQGVEHGGQLQPAERERIAVNEGVLAGIVLEEHAYATGRISQPFEDGERLDCGIGKNCQSALNIDPLIGA
jgi:hypothetical protein